VAKVDAHARHKARRLAVQALYQWQFTGYDASEIEAHFRADNDFKKVDSDYFHELLNNICIEAAVLDGQFAGFLDREIKALNPVELSILRLGTYELAQRLDIPYRVVINEATELAKIFGAEGGYKYVNGVLDKVAKAVRPEYE